MGSTESDALALLAQLGSPGYVAQSNDKRTTSLMHQPNSRIVAVAEFPRHHYFHGENIQ